MARGKNRSLISEVRMSLNFGNTYQSSSENWLYSPRRILAPWRRDLVNNNEMLFNQRWLMVDE